MSIETTLAERQKQHGDFAAHCEIESRLTALLTEHGQDLTAVQTVGLRMVMHKIARILNRGHAHVDSWHDIAGYATLVEKHMTRFNAELEDPVNE